MGNQKEDLIKKVLDEKNDIVVDDILLQEELVEEVEGREEVTLRDINNNIVDEFDVNKYLQENYSFAELDEMTLDEFISKEMEKPQVRNLKMLVDSKSHLKDFPKFEDIMLYKKNYGGIFIIIIGLDFEQEVFGIPVELFVCRTIKDSDHVEMLEKNPDAETDLEYMKKFMLSRAILFPYIREEDVPKLKVGVVDILLPAIMKHSRYNPTHKIIRI